ncbi:MAG: NADPH:quinone oxidoreductase family protein [Pseudomonadota bacterium]
MRSFQVTQFDSKANLAMIEKPTIREGETLVRVHACGLNFADLLMAKGTYQETPEPPFTLGMEIAGEVVTPARGLTGPESGTRVAAFLGSGGLADYAAVPVAAMTRVPDRMDSRTAAAFQVAYGTSHLALDHRANLKVGETLLVLGASGGVGLTSVEIGKLMGARVIACARGAEKLKVAKAAGADVLIDSDAGDLRERVRAEGGADVVYDPVGGALFKEALRATKPEGRVLTIGFASGEVPQIAANHILVKNITVIGFYWGGYLKFRPEVLTQSLSTPFDWYGQGKLKPHISATYPLEQADEAMDLLRSRKATGKVVVDLLDS